VTLGGGGGGSIDLTTAAVTTPPANTSRLFARSIAGRILPAAIGPSGLDTALQPLLARNKIAWANANGNSTAIGTMGIALTGTGTATIANVATTNIHTAIRRLEYAVTTAAAGAIAGFRLAAAQYHIGATNTPYGGFFSVCRFGRSRGDVGSLRGFVGFTSLTTAPTDVEPSTNVTNAIGVCCDVNDTNYFIVHRNGTAAPTKIDTGFPKGVPDASEMYELAIFTSPTSTSVGVQFERLSDGAVFNHTISTNLPAATTLLAYRGYYSSGGVTSVMGMALASLYIETDY
jgi:hypothetical protein